MTDQPAEVGVDLSVEPERMLAIRNRVREELVDKVHALRISARLHHRFGNREMARRQYADIRMTIEMIAALEDPMTEAEQPRPTVDLVEDGADDN